MEYAFLSDSVRVVSSRRGLITGVNVRRILGAIRNQEPNGKFYKFSSTELFGKTLEGLRTEQMPFYLRSPHGVADLYRHHITVNYRESYGVFACSGICLNHEFPRRRQ